MANYKKPSSVNYFVERQKAVEREGDKQTNLLFGIAEKTGVNLEEKYGIEFVQPVSTIAANTIKPERPRAWQLVYIRDTETLLVQYRDYTIVEYVGIPVEMWQDLKVTDSTGRYIDGSGIYEMPFRKVPKEQLPQEVQVLFK